MLEYNQQKVSLRIGRARGYEAEKHNERKRGMMKKIVSALAALAVAGGMCMPAFAAKKVETTKIPDSTYNYKFIDIAYDGQGTIVALAKGTSTAGEDYSYSHLYYSKDSGETWQRATEIGLNNFTYGNPITSNKKSQEQLVYWADKGMFVVHAAGGSMTSEDGADWDSNNNVHWTGEVKITDSDDILVMSGIDATNMTDSTTEKKFSDYKHDVSNFGVSQTIAASGIDENGIRKVFMTGRGRTYSVEIQQSDGTYQGKSCWQNGELGTGCQNAQGESLPQNAYDSVYTGASDQFIFVDGNNAFYVAKNNDGKNRFSQFVYKYSSPSNANVTGVNVNDNYIVLGMSDGTMYYTDNAAIGENTAWTRVPEMNAKEPVKNIEFIGDDEFVALSETGIYKGSLLADEPKPVTVEAKKITEETKDGSQGWTATIPAPAGAVTGGRWKITNGVGNVAEVDAKIDATMEGSFKIGLVLTKKAVGDNKISSVAFELK